MLWTLPRAFLCREFWFGSERAHGRDRALRAHWPVVPAQRFSMLLEEQVGARQVRGLARKLAGEGLLHGPVRRTVILLLAGITGARQHPQAVPVERQFRTCAAEQ